MQKLNSRLAFLDFLRIFSFASVLIGHKFYGKLYYLSETDAVHESLRYLIKLILPLCASGGAGVVVFFLVSGYVITHVLQAEKPIEFAIKRIFRIYPLYIFAVILQTFLAAKIYHVKPDFHVLIPQLFLIGNFFNTPCSLNGVEWTLRIEVLFYVFMFLMRYWGILNTNKILYAWIVVATTLILGQLPAMPVIETKAYLNLYGPFLFLGSFFYLYEKKFIGFQFLASFSLLILMQHWLLISYHQPNWRYAHFAVLAFGIFVALWSLREHLSNTTITLFLSELTYSVYVFHNWLFEYIRSLTIVGGIFQRDRYALLLLLAICAVFVKMVEKPGIRLGRKVLQKINSRKNSSVDSLDLDGKALS